MSHVDVKHALANSSSLDDDMSDTLWEKDGWCVNRFWGGKQRGDCIQITSPTEYIQITLAEWKEIAKNVTKNMRETKDAWWHHL